MGTQKNSLNETVLLNTQNICTNGVQRYKNDQETPESYTADLPTKSKETNSLFPIGMIEKPERTQYIFSFYLYLFRSYLSITSESASLEILIK